MPTSMSRRLFSCIAVLTLGADILLVPAVASAHTGSCTIIKHAPVNPSQSGTILSPGNPFDNNGVDCNGNAHASYDVKVLLQRSNDTTSWTTLDTGTGGPCSNQTYCWANAVSTTCTVGVTKWWRIKVTAVIKNSSGTIVHSPQGTTTPVSITCS